MMLAAMKVDHCQFNQQDDDEDNDDIDEDDGDDENEDEDSTVAPTQSTGEDTLDPLQRHRWMKMKEKWLRLSDHKHPNALRAIEKLVGEYVDDEDTYSKIEKLNKSEAEYNILVELYSLEGDDEDTKAQNDIRTLKLN